MEIEKRKKDKDKKRGEGGESVVLLCGPAEYEGAAPPRLTAILLPPLAARACSGLFAGSVLPADTHRHARTHTHTTFKIWQSVPMTAQN